MKQAQIIYAALWLGVLSNLTVADTIGKNTTISFKPVRHSYRELAGALLPIEAHVPSGCFLMGSPENELGRAENEIRHRVCLNAFKISKFEATMAEFRQFVSATGYVTDAERDKGQPGCWGYQLDAESNRLRWDWWPETTWKQPLGNMQLTDYHPVTCVSFQDVLAYIDWLNKQTGYHYRLPTEAEWEYAARAGSVTAYYWGNNAFATCSFANVADNSPSKYGHFPVRHRCQDGHFFTAEVGGYRPNAYALHDMIGNVWEWTCSGYEENYSGSELTCLSGKVKFDTLIAVRGGGWNADTVRVRAAHRNWGASWSRQANLGFRLVRDSIPNIKMPAGK